MRPRKPEPIRLSGEHCCACTAAHGGACGHIGPMLLCHQHMAARTVRDPFPWWVRPEQEPARDPDVSWDKLVP